MTRRHHLTVLVTVVSLAPVLAAAQDMTFMEAVRWGSADRIFDAVSAGQSP